MKKSFRTRIKITKRGKLIRRPMSVDHFRTRKSKKLLRNKRKELSLNFPLRSLRRA